MGDKAVTSAAAAQFLTGFAGAFCFNASSVLTFFHAACCVLSSQDCWCLHTES